MVCKEDVVSWFKELESYKRIDAMCSLLNMCLPFELRFIGTYLEELGKRDFQELRGAEVRANTNTDLAADIGGANTDHRTRRKMALYVSLLRSCNYACASTLYHVMVGLEQSGLLGGVYGDPLEELLLLYTMALHHPAFTFDQHTHFGEILEKLKLEDERNRYNPPVSVNTAPSTHSCILHTTVTPNLSVPSPSVSGLSPMNPLLYVKTPPLQAQPVQPGSEQLGEMINPLVNMGNSPMPSEPLYSIITDTVPLHSIPLPHFSMGEYNMVGPTSVPGHWPTPGHVIITPVNQPIEMLTYRPSSPVPSHSSSPCDSRPGSPPLHPMPPLPPLTSRRAPPHPPHIPHGPHLYRRLSQDTPPPTSHHLVPGFNSLSINERHLEGEKILDQDIQVKAMAQLQSIENQNGISRLSDRIVGGSGAVGTYCITQQQRSSLHQQSPSSDSSSSTESHSPPHHLPSPSPAAAPPYGRPPHSHYRPAFSPSPFPNGEGYPPPYPPSFLPPPVPPYAPPKLSCWNCGAGGHSGADCKEPFIDEVSRAAVYQLDYSTAPPDTNDK